MLEIDNFILHEKVPADLLSRYRDSLPTQIISIWENYGFGAFLDGYLKVINPEELSSLLKDSFDLWDESCIVLFATSMADLVVYKNSYLYFLNFRYSKFEVIAKDVKFFFIDIQDESFLDEELEWEPYLKAKKTLGEPAFDECFGYEPILAAGGSEKVENLRRLKLKEHISVITQFAGKI